MIAPFNYVGSPIGDSPTITPQPDEPVAAECNEVFASKGRHEVPITAMLMLKALAPASAY
jgi:hypothetical protein